MYNNDGLMLDYGSVVAIINKLKMYTEIEEKNIVNIENALSNLENYYSGTNSKILQKKTNDLYVALNTILENKKMYISYLNNMVNGYRQLDAQVAHNYNQDIN